MMVETTERRAELGTVRGVLPFGLHQFVLEASRSYGVTDERPHLLGGSVDEADDATPGLSAYFTSVAIGRTDNLEAVFAEADLNATVDADPIPGVEIRRKVWAIAISSCFCLGCCSS